MISGNGSTVRIVTFNVRGAVGPDGNVDPDAIADSIIALEPDVVLLQEVTRGWVIHGTMDLLEYLQARLQMTYVFERAADRQFGNAIFTQLTSAPAGAGLLPQVDAKQLRSYVAMTVRVSGSRLLVMNPHLEGRSAEQIQALLTVSGQCALS
jgi:endonuclease/exonuclease/phosphatase family metal-dependent hydrolase